MLGNSLLFMAHSNDKSRNVLTKQYKSKKNGGRSRKKESENRAKRKEHQQKAAYTGTQEQAQESSGKNIRRSRHRKHRLAGLPIKSKRVALPNDSNGCSSPAER